MSIKMIFKRPKCKIVNRRPKNPVEHAKRLRRWKDKYDRERAKLSSLDLLRMEDLTRGLTNAETRVKSGLALLSEFDINQLGRRLYHRAYKAAYRGPDKAARQVRGRRSSDAGRMDRETCEAVQDSRTVKRVLAMLDDDRRQM